MLPLALMLVLSVTPPQYTVCAGPEVGVIGADGQTCWTLDDYESLYGNPAWYASFLVDVGAWSHDDHMRWIIRRTWPDDLEDHAIALATCESGLNPAAGNFTGLDLRLNNGSVGLFQQGVKFWPGRAEQAGVPGADIRDPWANSIVSAWLQRVGGWGHWRNCARRIGVL